MRCSIYDRGYPKRDCKEGAFAEKKLDNLSAGVI